MIDARHCGARSRGRYFLTVLILAALAAPPPTYSQTDYGRLTVIVKGQRTPDGPAVAPPSPATVQLTDEVNRSRTCEVNTESVPSGQCVFETLEPGLYIISVSSPSASEPQTVQTRIASGQRVTRTVMLLFRDTSVTTEKLDPDKIVPQPPPVAPPLVVDESIRERVFAERLGVSVRAVEEDRRPRSSERFESVLQTQPGSVSVDDGGVSGFSFFGQPGSQNVLRVAGVSDLAPELQDTSFQDTGAFVFDVSKRQSIKSYSSFSASTNNTPAKFGTGTGGQLIKDITKGDKTVAGEVYNYFAHDALSARNFFDFAEKPELRFDLFGFKLGGPLVTVENGTDKKVKLAYFINYEGIRARSTRTVYEAAPSLALRAQAAPAVVSLFDSFRAGGATTVAGAATDPDNFDILKLETQNRARRDAFTARLDFRPNDLDTFAFIYVGARAKEETPDGASGRRLDKGDRSHTAIFNYTRPLIQEFDEKGEVKKNVLTNEFIFGLKTDPTRLDARLPSALGLSQFNVSIGGKAGQGGVPGLSSELGLAAPGGLLREAAGFKGRALRFTPNSYSFVDQMTWNKSDQHTFTFGGEVRLQRHLMNRLFGTTYSFASLADFLANKLSSVELVGDLGSFTGEPGPRETGQEYYIGYAQDAWRPKNNLLLTFGLRYEYYTVLREARDRAVLFNTATGTPLPAGTSFYKSRRDNFLPRVAVAWAPRPSGEQDDPINTSPFVLSGSFGVHTGPDALDIILRPVYSDSIRATRRGGTFPVDPGALAAEFAANTETRAFQPLAIAPDFIGATRVYKYDASLKWELIGREISGSGTTKKVLQELFLTLTYSGNAGRNLPRINFANRIVGVEDDPDPTQPARVRREFDLMREGQPRSPLGVIEYYTSGGRSRYDSFQVSLNGISTNRYLQLLEAQYTWSKSRGNTDPDSTIPAGHPSDDEYDYGYNSGDARHKFSLATVFALGECDNVGFCRDRRNRFARTLLSGWTFAAVGSYQTGQPIDVRLRRSDVVYLDADGNVFNSPAAGGRAVINVPGGGSSVAALRPNLVPGVNPFTGGFNDRQFLNPAAFAIPAPGTFGDLRRGDLRGPHLRLFDISVRREFTLPRPKKLKGGNDEALFKLIFNVDVNNVFNITNFRLAAATLPDAIGLDGTDRVLQPGQAFTEEAAGTFGVITRTFKRKQDLGASRQIQFRVAFQF